MFTYTFTKAPIKQGEYDPKYGTAWWGETNEQLEPVRFNLMSQQEITINSKIEAEERVEKKSAKGVNYFQLRKVKVVGSEAKPTPTSSSDKSDISARLDRIEKILIQIQEKLNGGEGDPNEIPFD